MLVTSQAGRQGVTGLVFASLAAPAQTARLQWLGYPLHHWGLRDQAGGWVGGGQMDPKARVLPRSQAPASPAKHPLAPEAACRDAQVGFRLPAIYGALRYQLEVA